MQDPLLPRFLFALELTVVGMTVVFLGLIFLQFAINVIGWVERGLTRPKAQAAGPAGMPASPSADATPSGITPETVVVIAAAVAEVLGENAKIHHIQMLQNEEQAGWGRIGRLDIMRSHNTSGAKR